MLTVDRVNEIRRQLAAGHSARRVAKQTGCSRGTVARVADGVCVGRRVEGEHVGFDGVLGRCPDCGHLVLLPCLACFVRRRIANRRL